MAKPYRRWDAYLSCRADMTAPPSDRPLPPADSFKLIENDFVHGLLGCLSREASHAPGSAANICTLFLGAMGWSGTHFGVLLW